MQFHVVTAQRFIIQRDQLHLSLAPFVTPLTEKEYMQLGAVLYLSSDRMCGFGITASGEIISVFSLHKGRGDLIARAAIERDGFYLDCLGEHLRELYERAGLVVHHSLPWNDEYAPDDWDYERFGRPTYYEMALPAYLAMASK